MNTLTTSQLTEEIDRLSVLPGELLIKIIQYIPFMDIVKNVHLTSKKLSVFRMYTHFFKDYLHPFALEKIEKLEEMKKTSPQIFAQKMKLLYDCEEVSFIRLIRDLIEECPYIVKPEYLQRYFPEYYESVTKELGALEDFDNQQKYLTDIIIEFHNHPISLVALDMFLLEDKYTQSIFLSKNELPQCGRMLSMNPLYYLLYPRVWDSFFKECKRECKAILEKSDSAFNREPTFDEVNSKILDKLIFEVTPEEVTLAFLYNTACRKILLEHPRSVDYLEQVVNKSVDLCFEECDMSIIPTTHVRELGIAQPLASALFIIKDAQYKASLASLDKWKIERLVKRTGKLERIDKGRNAKEARDDAMQILNKLTELQKTSAEEAQTTVVHRLRM